MWAFSLRHGIPAQHDEDAVTTEILAISHALLVGGRACAVQQIDELELNADVRG